MKSNTFLFIVSVIICLFMMNVIIINIMIAGHRKSIPDESDLRHEMRQASVSLGGGSSKYIDSGPSKGKFAPGTAIIIDWESEHATRVVSSNFGAKSLSGSTIVYPMVTTTYTITVADASSTATASITIQIGQPDNTGK